MRDRIFYGISFGFMVGVLLRSLVYVNLYLVTLLALLAIVLFIFFSLISRSNWGIIVSLSVLGLSLGIFRLDTSLIEEPVTLAVEKISVVGEIVEEPDIRETNQKLTLEGDIEGVESRVLVTTSLSGNYQYGDEVKVEGLVERPENFLTDQGKEFDYVNYLKKDGILYLMNYPQIELLSKGNGNFLKSNLFTLKRKFLEKINFAIPPPESLLLGGLIVGERSPFSSELRQDFIDTGTIHLVALSGYNVSLVADWIIKIFSFLPPNLSFGAGIMGIILFVIMAGSSSTAVRAGFMAILVLVARFTGRTYEVGRALVLAAFLMILFNPLVLVHDVSFQLSFIATVAVIFFAPRIEKYFLWLPQKFKLREIISVTAAAYIFVLPFVLYKMGNLSLVALPANILVLPVIPLTMVLGFITGALGLIWSVLGLPFGYLTYLVLKYELEIINFFSNFQFASLTIPNFPLFLVIAIYLYFIYILFGKSIKEFFGAKF